MRKRYYRQNSGKVHTGTRGLFPSQGVLRCLLKTLVLLVFFSHLAGCASVYVLPDTEQRAVNAGEKTIVSMRIHCKIDNLSGEAFGTSGWTGEPHVALGIGSFETVGEPRRAVHHFLSEESRSAGWTYLVLPPGVYYLAVVGPQSDASLKDLREAPRWRIDVPENTEFLYAGTLVLFGKTHGTFLLGGKIVKPADGEEVVINDESEAAKNLLSKYISHGAETKTILMQRWRRGDPIIIKSPRPDSRK